MHKPICTNCNKTPCAINYVKNNITHYRSKCDRCARQVLAKTPDWQRQGYKKKNYCEKCGFKSRHKDQLRVYHINGRRGDCHPTNLKTVCLNCEVDIQRSKVGWIQGDLVPDF